jgi:UDP-N-acetylglucosamine 2-epimerase (non-hydrolysing)
MDRIFFEQLELPMPAYNLNVGSGGHAEQTGKIMAGVEKILLRECPEIVLVQGDTNTVLAGALAASKLNTRVGHIEAGLRSYDRSMPEEINRVLADHISNYLFSPTEVSRGNLLQEGIKDDMIYVTGNTIVDAVYQNLEIATRKESILEKFSLTSKEYILATIHRQENVDSKIRLQEILGGLEMIAEELSMPMIFPTHPRTRKMIREFGLNLRRILCVEPLGFLEFLEIEANARLVLTDSGGIQEEACILGVPCITLRDNTERPETVEVGANILAGARSNFILEAAKLMINKKICWGNPFGDGKTGEKILRIIDNNKR